MYIAFWLQVKIKIELVSLLKTSFLFRKCKYKIPSIHLNTNSHPFRLLNYEIETALNQKLYCVSNILSFFCCMYVYFYKSSQSNCLIEFLKSARKANTIKQSTIIFMFPKHSTFKPITSYTTPNNFSFCLLPLKKLTNFRP